MIGVIFVKIGVGPLVVFTLEMGKDNINIQKYIHTKYVLSILRR